MKRKIIPIILLLFLLIGLKFTFDAPTYLYKRIITQGIDSGLLVLPLTPMSLRTPHSYQPDTITINNQAWKKVHFDHFSFFIPARNPLLTLVPNAKEENKDLILEQNFGIHKRKYVFF